LSVVWLLAVRRWPSDTFWRYTQQPNHTHVNHWITTKTRIITEDQTGIVVYADESNNLQQAGVEVGVKDW